MSTLSLIILAATALVAFGFYSIEGHLRALLDVARAIDAELFHLAQMKEPFYGLCSECGKRRIVRHVVRKGAKAGDDYGHEMFLCQPCHWLSSEVMLASDELAYKDRPTKDDRHAAHVGPG